MAVARPGVTGNTGDAEVHAVSLNNCSRNLPVSFLLVVVVVFFFVCLFVGWFLKIFINSAKMHELISSRCLLLHQGWN